MIFLVSRAKFLGQFFSFDPSILFTFLNVSYFAEQVSGVNKKGGFFVFFLRGPKINHPFLNPCLGKSSRLTLHIWGLNSLRKVQSTYFAYLRVKLFDEPNTKYYVSSDHWLVVGNISSYASNCPCNSLPVCGFLSIPSGKKQIACFVLFLFFFTNIRFPTKHRKSFFQLFALAEENSPSTAHIQEKFRGKQVILNCLYLGDNSNTGMVHKAAICHHHRLPPCLLVTAKGCDCLPMVVPFPARYTGIFEGYSLSFVPSAAQPKIWGK